MLALFLVWPLGPLVSNIRHFCGDASHIISQHFTSSSHIISHHCCRVEELRMATGRLGEIAGEVQSESVLDALFKEFCIGK